MTEQAHDFNVSRKAINLSGLCQALAVLLNDMPSGAENTHERQSMEGICAIAEVLIPMSGELCEAIEKLEWGLRKSSASADA